MINTCMFDMNHQYDSFAYKLSCYNNLTGQSFAWTAAAAFCASCASNTQVLAGIPSTDRESWPNLKGFWLRKTNSYWPRHHSYKAVQSRSTHQQKLWMKCTSFINLGQSSHRIWRLLILVLVQTAEGLPTQLQITYRIIALNCLVEIGIKRHLLDILLLAEFHKTFTCSITGVEDFLQQIKHQIGRAILACLHLLLKAGSWWIKKGNQPSSYLDQRLGRQKEQHVQMHTSQYFQ